MRALSLIAATLLALIAAALAPQARAAVPIDFEGLAAATIVSTQFEGDGVVFLGPPDSTGLPLVADVGVQAGSGTKVAFSQCPGCEFVHHVIRARLPQTRDSVSARVGLQSGIAGTGPVTLNALDAGKAVIASTTATVPFGDYGTVMTVDAPGTDAIAYLELRTSDAAVVGAPIGIDDVTYTGGGAGVPDVSVSTGTVNLQLLLGGAVDLPVTVSRLNGSSGDVAMSVAGLPPGVTGTFTPAVLSGGQSETTLRLEATTAAPDSLVPHDVTVTATPADALAGPAPRTAGALLVVRAPFSLGFPAGPVRVPSCGTGTGTVSVNRAPGFTGPVTLSVDPVPGVDVGLGETVVTPSGGSFSTAVPLTVTRPGTGQMAGGTVTVRATSPGAPDATGTVPFVRYAGEITDVSPLSGRAPGSLLGGDPVTITGTGLCPGSVIRFGNAAAEAAPPPSAFAPGGTRATVPIPRYATSGPVTVVAPDGTFTSAQSVTVRGFRGMAGFAFDNYGGDDASLDDIRAVYGASQTNITLDVCWPFGCDVVTPIPNPFAYLYLTISNGFLAGKGSCFGMSIVSQRLAEGWTRYASFTPAGATTAWQLDARPGPGADLEKAIRGWHSAQLSSEFIQHWVAQATRNLAEGGSSTRGTIESQIRAGHHPILVLRNSVSEGHVVVASDVRSASDGGYDIDVYDPNVPYLTGEGTDAASRRDREDRSVVHVRPDGHWSHVGAYASTWSGGPGTLVAVPWGTVPRTPTMPTTIRGLLTLIVPIAADGAPAPQVTDARGDRLIGPGGDLETRLGQGIEGAQILAPALGVPGRPVYALPGVGPYTQTVAGTGAGGTGAAVLAPGFAGLVEGAGTRRGGETGIQVAAARGEVGVTAPAGGALRARLARARGDAQYGADVRVAGADPGTQRLALDVRAGALRFTNAGGAATMRATLTWAGPAGAPGSVDVGPVPVPARGTAVVAPRDWTGLAASPVALTVRDARGRVVRRRTIPGRAPRRVVSVKVASTGGTVAVTARLRGVPRTAEVQVALNVLRGRTRVVSQVSELPAARARGRRVVSFALPPLPKGSYTAVGSVVISGAVAAAPITESRSARARIRR